MRTPPTRSTALLALLALAAPAALGTGDAAAPAEPGSSLRVPGSSPGSSLRVRVETAEPPALRAALESAGYDVLPAAATPGAVEVIVTGPAELESLRGAGHVVTIVERGRPLRDVLRERQTARGGVPEGYLDLAEVLARMAELAGAHPTICQLVDLTETYGVPATFEGRHLHAVRISDNVGQDEDEPTVFVVSNHHAREIVTPVIALHAIEQLTGRYGKDEQITRLVDDNEIWIAPVWNPDGYAYVFDGDNLWRKNRRVFKTGIGVDTNRNYPFGWFSPCSGSESPSSGTYKGPEPASEPETMTALAWSTDRHFARVIDYHSRGREVLWAYACLDLHPFDAFLRDEAVALSEGCGYEGAVRGPSADGEHYQWQLGTRGAHTFLIETHDDFQPEYESAVDEAVQVFPGLLAFLDAAIPLTGHVIDAATGAPVVATVTPLGLTFGNGETITSGGPFGRYYGFFPAGPYEIAWAAEGYLPQTHVVDVVAGTETRRDIRLTPPEFIGDVNRDGVVDFEDILALLPAWGPCPDPPGPCPADFDGDGEITFADILAVLSNWS